MLSSVLETRAALAGKTKQRVGQPSLLPFPPAPPCPPDPWVLLLSLALSALLVLQLSLSGLRFLMQLSLPGSLVLHHAWCTWLTVSLSV